ncbi:DEAD/DEAH box helicase [Streptococcus sanguinis]|uniref:ATP-dependent helicase HepA n=1 Tax=Streptococcus sanguinis TaxID=1305 RepID=A0AB74DHL8_STRSA|nr:DEAD/DEAH box helicase [Streptococcus sanguinis]RSI28852.1 ATP-dependent helicase HepA [Streptococcus sanguinis]RSI33234.1 ATP-dependent helicase HepA [Streptococcus sanguinis]
MAKLIPGKIRTEGIDLVENDKVVILEVSDSLLYARVDECNLRYSLDDDVIFCYCDFFQKKKYCAHLAALEYYLKNAPSGKDVLKSMEEEELTSQETQELVSFGSLFLDKVLPDKSNQQVRYELSATGQEDSYTGQFLWSLRISRLPDERSYVVRDVLSFLRTLEKGGHYQIGKSYYEAIHLEDFDEASQDLLVFLQGLVSDYQGQDSSLIFPNAGRNLFFPASIFEEGVIFLMNLSSFRLEYSLYDYSEVFFQDLHEEAEVYTFQVEEHEEHFELVIAEKNYKMLYDGQFIFYGDTFYQLNPQQIRLMKALRELPIEHDRLKRLQFDLSERTKLASSLSEFEKVGRVEAPESMMIHDFTAKFAFDIGPDKRLILDTVFDYGDRKVTTRKDLERLPFAGNFEHEQQVFKQMLQAGFVADFYSQRPPLKPEEIYHFFLEVIPNFEALGRVSMTEELEALAQTESPRISVKMKGGLLDVGFDFAGIAQSEVDAVLDSLFKEQDFFISKSGQVLIFDEETKEMSRTLQQLRSKRTKNGFIQTSSLAAYQLAEFFKGKDRVQFSKNVQQLAFDLTHPEEFPLPELQVKADLRDYQETGVKWLSMLDKYGFGGILADDMGLGKTLQTISFLSSRIDDSKKVLILAPSSLIYNWSDEFAKFAPHLDVAVVYGLKNVRDELIAEKHQITITSYASFRQDVEEYRDNHFQYLILDEAQVMKNDQTKIAQYLRDFEVEHTYALSGTPIENNLGELWSIFQIVMPGLLPNKKEFLKLPADKVARYIKPFVMRRKKEDVLQELPDLIEVAYRNELADSQKTIYLALLKQMQDRIIHATEDEINRSKIEILSGLMRLRQICDTPKLFMEDYEGESGKLESLRELLEQIQDGNRRVLIFSQFRGMLDIIESELEKMEMESFKITGSTPAKERQDMTTSFNDGQRSAFLISLKAGGVGLNLTGADTVILVDLWWNPAVEAQAIGRAHRIGQERNVEVYRMITRGTIEEKIQELQESKRNLVSTILDGAEAKSSLSVEEIREILGISAE